ncbi:FimB/Mfa2 family fimbrial subunit [Bacteroides sp. UBA939]|uniref:FimB/Mfa2 family fimbrial subunit n=1 Tax=Bacteroides sp. UBA939 TaxID=1946092 RepID=UPI0025C34629|nr:FimB/Mfa2 family fimbrial subunit [Bacteroides sp. UBA939]
MKTTRFIIAGLLCSFLFVGCDKEEAGFPELPSGGDEPSEIVSSEIPDGYFEAIFSPGQMGSDTRVPVSGQDSRVRSIRYVVYKATGEYVKERMILNPADAIPTWPYAAIKDTLPKGEYTAVFLANMLSTQFPIPSEQATTYQDILTNYQTTRADARINLPGAEFTDNSEFYFASVSFSDVSPQPTVLLQRIISMLNLSRLLIDAQDALDSLVGNIVEQLHYEDLIETTLKGVLPGALEEGLGKIPGANVVFLAVGGLDGAVNLVSENLLAPLVDALYKMLLQQLVAQLAKTLTANSSQSDLLGLLGGLLNPWNVADAGYAVVTINDFPKAIDLDLNVTDVHSGEHKFLYNLATLPGAVNSEKSILIRGFEGLYDVRGINVAKVGLVSGLVVDGILDSDWLLTGALVDITDSIAVTTEANFRYESDYSVLSLGLKDYTQQEDGEEGLSLSLKLSEVANLNDVLGGIPVLGPILSKLIDTLMPLLDKIVVAVPLNVPLLSIDNLKISGGWSVPETY